MAKENRYRVLDYSLPQDFPSRSFLEFVDGAWVGWLICLIGVFSVFATALQTLRLSAGLPSAINLAIATSLTIVICIAVWRNGSRISGPISAQICKVGSVPLWLLASIGIGIRILWVLVFPAEPGSDGATYLMLARRILDGVPYEADGLRAYWPIGYPAFLAVWLFVQNGSSSAYIIANIFLFVVGFFGVAKLADLLAGRPAGNVAALLFALWPNLIFCSATPEKESLVVAILPWVTLLILRSSLKTSTLWPTFIASVLLGSAVMVQPSLQFLPLVAVIIFFGLLGFGRVAVIRAGVLLVLVGLVISPWAIRNYDIFNRFVPVATSGGFNLYRANNPIATGGYMPAGQISLSHLDELERDRAARNLAFEWIQENPGKFVALSFEKQIRFMGDDAVGVYTTLKVGKASSSFFLYAFLKALANGWWLAVWIAIIVFSLDIYRFGMLLPVLSRTPIWVWLYLLSIHSVFESAGKYHVAVIWVPCVLFGVFAKTIRACRPV